LRASPSASTSTHPRGLLRVNVNCCSYCARIALDKSIGRQHRLYCSYSSSAGYLVPRSILLIFFECGLSCPSKRTAYILRVRAILSLEAYCLYYSSAGFGPSNHLLWAKSAFELFECGLRSLELFSSGQQRLCIIRARASVPRIILFGPAAPLRYLSTGFGPLNYSFRASSASALFERGLWSLELFFLGQQRLYVIRGRALSLELFSSGQQCLYVIRVWVSIPQIASFGHQCFHSIRIRTAILRISVLCYQCFRIAFRKKAATESEQPSLTP
jgi:hypothetical protein